MASGMQPTRSQMEVVGLIPAGGHGKRLGLLPCSKEVLPIGFSSRVDGDAGVSPKVVCQYLLEKFQVAGITKAYIVLKKGKWDIPAYLGDGALADMHLAYLMLGLPFGVPYTLDQAYPFVHDKVVALGFPDVVFQAGDAFVLLLNRLSKSKADVVLGVFPADRADKVDMVELDEHSRILRIVIKPKSSDLTHSWTIAVWTPVFTRYMREYVSASKPSAETSPELFVGDVIQAAIKDGLTVEGVHVSDEPYVDIGTPEDLTRVMNLLAVRKRVV